MSFLGIGSAPQATPGATGQNVMKAAASVAGLFNSQQYGNDRNQLNNFYNTVMGQQAPQGNAASAGNAATAGNTQLAPAAQTGAASAGNAAMTNAANAGSAINASAANAGNAAMSRAANINTVNSNQDRAGQQALNTQLSNIATGQAPSAGQLQFQQSQAANIAAANAAAQSGRTGQNPQLIARNLQSNLANQNSTAAVQGAQLSLQQQQAAQQQLASNLGTMAGQDASSAQAQASLNQQTALANQGALNQQSALNSGYQQAANLQNAAAANAMAATNAGYQQTANLANQAAANQMAQYNASNVQASNLANQSALNTAAAQQASLNQQTALANQAAINTQNQFNATQQNAMTQANMQAQLGQNQLSDQTGLQALGQTDALDQQQVANQEAALQAHQAEEQITNNFNQGQTSAVLGGIGQIAGGIGGAIGGLAALSDKTKKKKIKSAEKQLSELLDKLAGTRKVSDANLKQNITTSFNDNPFNQFHAMTPVIQMPSTQGAANFGKAIGTAISGGINVADKLSAPSSAPISAPGYSAPNMPTPSSYSAPSVGAGSAGYSGVPTTATVGADGLEGLAAVSDEKEKDGKRSVAQALGDMLDKLTAYQYEYKDSAKGLPGVTPGQHVGVMAQDLEQSPAGKMFVETAPEGHKVVKYGEMLPALLASMAMLHKRTKALEGQ